MKDRTKKRVDASPYTDAIVRTAVNSSNPILINKALGKVIDLAELYSPGP